MHGDNALVAAHNVDISVLMLMFVAADQAHSAEAAKQTAEGAARRFEQELAAAKVTEQRLRQRLAKKDGKSQGRTQVWHLLTLTATKVGPDSRVPVEKPQSHGIPDICLGPFNL